MIPGTAVLLPEVPAGICGYLRVSETAVVWNTVPAIWRCRGLRPVVVSRSPRTLHPVTYKKTCKDSSILLKTLVSTSSIFKRCSWNSKFVMYHASSMNSVIELFPYSSYSSWCHTNTRIYIGTGIYIYTVCAGGYSCTPINSRLLASVDVFICIIPGTNYSWCIHAVLRVILCMCNRNEISQVCTPRELSSHSVIILSMYIRLYRYLTYTLRSIIVWIPGTLPPYTFTPIQHQ